MIRNRHFHPSFNGEIQLQRQQQLDQPVSCVFRICYTDSIGVQEDQYPPNIAVKVNQSYCHVPVSDGSSQDEQSVDFGWIL